jgi:hypothetical protein
MSAVDYFLKIDGIKGESKIRNTAAKSKSVFPRVDTGGGFAQGDGGGACRSEHARLPFHGVSRRGQSKLMLVRTGAHSTAVGGPQSGERSADYMKVAF